MTVTRYKRDRSSEAIKDAVLGVISHKREAQPADVAKPATTASVASIAPAAETVKPMRINPNTLARAKRKRPEGHNSTTLAKNLFKAYRPPPGVLPENATPDLAMDAGLQGWAETSFTSAWNFANPQDSSFAEGIGFLGYAYLSQLTERPEYRRISERLAIEMTRKWIRLTVSGEADPESKEGDDDAKANDTLGFDRQPDADLDLDEDEDADGAAAGGAVADNDDDEQDDEPTPEEKAQRERNEALQKKLKEIDADMKRLDVRGKFKSIAEFDGWMGRSHLYIDTGDSNDPVELKTNLGNGSDDISKEKFKKGSLRNIKPIEAIWCYPVNYNANDPLADDWYNPQLWFAMAKQVHVSRLLTFVGRPLPDILKPSYAFGGLSMSQMAKPYVDNWLRTRQAVTNLIESFSVSGIYTNAQSLLQGGGDEVLDRIEMFIGTRSNLGSMVLDKETEEYFNISTPLGTLDQLQAQSQEQMSAVSGIPLIVLLGITPHGLNASSEGELRVFYDLVHAMQESLFRDKLKRVIDFIQLHLYGEVDPAIGFEFEPLWSLDEKGEAEVRKLKMETHNGYVDMGVISQEEVRKIEIEDDNSPYNGLEPDDMPDLKQEETDGLVPGGGAGAGAGGMGGNNDNKEVEGAADSIPLDPIEVAPDVWAFDAPWEEGKHKRDDGGKFAETAGSGGAEGEPEGEEKTPTFKSKKEHIGHLLTNGTTPKELMVAMGWPSVSMPAQAKSLGMKLEKKDGKYFGVKMTDAELKAAKEEAVGKKTDAEAQQILKNAGLGKEGLGGKNNAGEKAPPLEPAKMPSKKEFAATTSAALKKVSEPDEVKSATTEELKKAKKSTPLPISSSDPDAAQAIKDFNEKYAGKEGLSTAALNQKVHDHKKLMGLVQEKEAVAQAAAAEKATEAQKKAQAQAKKNADALVAKAKAEAEESAKKNQHVMTELGISAQQAQGFVALASMLGGKQGDVEQKFKAYADEAKAYGYPITGFQAALIKNYSNGGYAAINEQLRSGAWTPAQHVYVAMVNKALAAMPAHKGQLTRGTTLSQQQQTKYVEGHIIQEPSFTSSSTGKGFGGNTTFKITAVGKRGASIKKLSNHPGESEVLFQARTFFNVTKVEGKPGGAMTIHMEEWEEH